MPQDNSALDRQGKWVPLEPTQEMMDAAKPAFATIDAWCAEMQLARGRKPDWPADDPPLKQAWRAMLAAAPHASAQTGEGFDMMAELKRRMADGPASGSPDGAK